MISSKVNCGTKAANTQHEICFNAEHEPYRSRRLRCKQLCEQFNLASPLNSVERKNILFSLVGAHFPVFIESFFQCEYGENIRIGAETFINHNVTIYDSATVTIGKNVLIGPNCTINTVISNEGNAISCSPITIGNNVWIGANVVICGGVEIGDNTIIGAGCIVRQSVRSHEIMKCNSL